MQTATMTLTEFLLARIAEDEAEVGVDLTGHDDSAGPNGIGWAEVGASSEVLIASQRRVLAECEAKRRIVDEHSDGQGSEKFMEPFCSTCSENEHLVYLPCPTLRILAAVYADHPDYRDEWRP